MIYHQKDFNTTPISSRRRQFFIYAGLSILIIAGFGAFQWVKSFTNQEIAIDNHGSLFSRVINVLPLAEDDADAKLYVMPPAEKNRLDILIMGIRGKDDPDGGLLTDTMMLYSFDQKTGKSTLVSIPRDLYVRIDRTTHDKINSAYERIGLTATKKLVSEVTGVYVDHAVVIDFSAFKELVDAVGGIDITLAKPFEETTQWGYVFSLPAGENHLDSEQTLYYVRSRYSSSDFDRAARQQQVILALKDKLLSLNLLSDPIKALSLINTIRTNVRTDINLLDIKSLIQLATQFNASAATMKRYVLTTDNLLYESKTDAGAYILLPKGDTFDQIKEFFQTILTGPSPTPSISPQP